MSSDTPHALISGAGIGGPALAHQLEARGWRTTIVERAPALREEGQNVDVRGTAREVVRRMGLEEEVLAAGTTEVGTRYVDASGREVAAFPAGAGDTVGFTAEAEILRGTLARLLYERTRDTTEYRFDDRIREVRERADGVTAVLGSGDTVDADVLVVAEGTRSRTRALLFDEVHLEEIGLYVAHLAMPRIPGDDRWWSVHQATGSRGVSLRPDHLGGIRGSLTFLSPVRGLESLGRDDQAALLRRTFADAGWQSGRVLDALDAAPFYFDAVATVRLPTWSAGRTVLLGDAAWSAGPFGTGTSMALTGAYVLAGELAARPDDPRTALARYETVMRPFVTSAQGVTARRIRLANPSSTLGIRALHGVLRLASSRPLTAAFQRLTAPPAETISLPAYPAPLSAAPR